MLEGFYIATQNSEILLVHTNSIPYFLKLRTADSIFFRTVDKNFAIISLYNFKFAFKI
jgi:hypothetical protein